MEAPRLPSIFRNVKREPRKFRYKPKHYDPREEAIEERKRKLDVEIARENGEEASGRKPSFRKSWQKQSYSSGASMANMRLVLILIVLIGLSLAVFRWLEKFS